MSAVLSPRLMEYVVVANRNGDRPFLCEGCQRAVNVRLVHGAQAVLGSLLATAPAALPVLTIMHICSKQQTWLNTVTFGDLRQLAEGRTIEA